MSFFTFPPHLCIRKLHYLRRQKSIVFFIIPSCCYIRTFCFQVIIGAYSDVLRKTNHTVLGYKRGMLFCVYCKNMTAAQVNSLCRDNMRFEKAIMLDGGHVAAINGANNKINTTQKQYYAIKAV